MADPIKFGTDGWRGVIARDFTFQNCRRVAQAIADYVKEEQIKDKKGPLSGPMVIGYDKRFQSDAFAREIAKVLEANQMNPILMAEACGTPITSSTERKMSGWLRLSSPRVSTHFAFCAVAVMQSISLLVKSY